MMVNLVKGATYHVYGWNFKAVFKLVDWSGGVATLQTPKTGRITHAPTSKLFYTKHSKAKKQGNDLPTERPDKHTDVTLRPNNKQSRKN